LHSAPAFAQKKRLLAMGEEKAYRGEAVSHAMAVIKRVGAQRRLWDTTIRTDTVVQKLGFSANTLNDFHTVLFYSGGDVEMTAQQRADRLSFVHDDGKVLCKEIGSIYMLQLRRTILANIVWQYDGFTKHWQNKGDFRFNAVTMILRMAAQKPGCHSEDILCK
jgi:hypothetical protein